MVFDTLRNGSRTKFFLFLAILCFLLLLYLFFHGVSTPPTKVHPAKSWWQPSQKWMPYSYKQFRDKSWFYKTCVPGVESTALEDLPNLINVWKYKKITECRLMTVGVVETVMGQGILNWELSRASELENFYDYQDHERRFYLIFTNILSVVSQSAEVGIPKSFESKVKGWLGNNEEVFQEAHNQTVIFIFNEYTREQNTYNAIRNKRPMAIPDESERAYVDSLSEKTEESCDFCKYKEYTAVDKFGHIEGKFSYSSGNTFKLDHWHALFMLRQHHPLNWKEKEFLDIMDTAQLWFEKVYRESKEFKYPAIVWDLLPHAGASQVHPHLHGFLDSKRYQGAMENVRLAAVNYQQDFPGHNYFQDWVEIHSILGLTVKYGTAVAVASLVPKKDNEVVIISAKPNKDFFQLVYFVIRAFLDDMEQLCYSAGIALPSMTGEVGSDSLPAYMRIVTRGAVAEIRSDVSSLELFLSPNANTDPFKVIKYIKESVKKRATVAR